MRIRPHAASSPCAVTVTHLWGTHGVPGTVLNASGFSLHPGLQHPHLSIRPTLQNYSVGQLLGAALPLVEGLLCHWQGPREGSANASRAVPQHGPSVLGPSFPLALQAREGSREKRGLTSASSSSEGGGVRRRGWHGLWLQAAPLTPETAGWPGPRARAILLWKAVAEMAWAGDMGAMLCRALSLAAWSWGDIGREGLSSGHYGRCGRGRVRACTQGSCPTASGQSPGQGPGGPAHAPAVL